MKKLLFIGIAAAALSGAPAIAAELPLKAAPLLFDWTGWYGGVNTGYSWGRSRTTISNGPLTTNPTPLDTSIRHRGWEFSGEGGYCWQRNGGFVATNLPTVTCIEVRYDGPRERGHLTTTILGDPGDVQPRPPSTIMIGPHLGVLTDANMMMWYLAGGLAIGQSETQATIAGFQASADKWKAGFFLGAGVERMINRNWSWKLEYDYVRFGGSGVSATFPVGLGSRVGNLNLFANPVTIAGNKDAYDNKISFGINYHFGSH
jgi:outer membrane immunogenic protein